MYVMSAPLLFGGVKHVVHPLLGLFCTRFVVEVLSMARGHWAVAVSRGSGRAIEPVRVGIPLLPD